MKKYLVVFIFPLLFFSKIDGQDLNRFDGPFVSYQNDSVIVRSINPGNEVTVNNFLSAEKSKHSLSVHFSNHSGWDFNISLRDSILIEPCEWKAPSKIFAVSDIEGEFEAFRNLLIAGNVIDSLYHWTFGQGHVIICGDLFDRGNDVIPELWLLYKLEDEAKTNGGYVHTILGNHDIMNLSGDLRYVQPKYLEHAKLMGISYMDFFNRSTELGRWLRSKNTIERIGKNLCLHGGVSPQLLSKELSLKQINNYSRPYFDTPEDSIPLHLTVFFGDNAPFWYRGYFVQPKASMGMVDSTLFYYNCRRIIVGHTITNVNIASYYREKIIGLDVNEHEGRSEAILIEDNKIYVLDKNGNRRSIIAAPGSSGIQ